MAKFYGYKEINNDLQSTTAMKENKLRKELGSNMNNIKYFADRSKKYELYLKHFPNNKELMYFVFKSINSHTDFYNKLSESAEHFIIKSSLFEKNNIKLNLLCVNRYNTKKSFKYASIELFDITFENEVLIDKYKYIIDIMVTFDHSNPIEYKELWSGKLYLEVVVSNDIEWWKEIDLINNNLPLFKIDMNNRKKFPELTFSDIYSENDNYNHCKNYIKKMNNEDGVNIIMINDPAKSLIDEIKKLNDKCKEQNDEIEKLNLRIKQINNLLSLRESEIKKKSELLNKKCMELDSLNKLIENLKSKKQYRKWIKNNN